MTETLSLPETAATAPNTKHIGIVAAWMLWPDNADKRQQYVETLACVYLLNTLNESQRPLSWDVGAAAIKMALDATPPEEFAREMAGRMSRGTAFGVALQNVCLRASRGEKHPMKRTFREIEMALTGKRKASESSHFNKLWESYRAVCGLWAAYEHLYPDTSGHLIDEFPCKPADLPKLLTYADAFRLLAESTSVPHRRDPVLKLGVHVTIPEHVLKHLPVGQLLKKWKAAIDDRSTHKS